MMQIQLRMFKFRALPVTLAYSLAPRRRFLPPGLGSGSLSENTNGVGGGGGGGGGRTGCIVCVACRGGGFNLHACYRWAATAVACSGATGSASGPQRAHGACHTCCCHRRKGPRQVLQPQEGQRRDGRKARQRASLGWYQCQRRGLPLAVGSHDPESDPVQGGPAGPAGRHPPRKGLPGTDPALFPLGQRSSGAYQWLGHACAMPWAQGRGTLQT
jgi:hypothetical protein